MRSSDQIEAAQQDAWSKTFDYVFAKSPFYREHFRRAGLSPAQSLPLAELSRIPSITKAEVSANPASFLCVDQSRVVDIVTTSGSTGQPLAWMLTDADLERLARNEELSFAAAGFTESDTVLLAVAMDRCFIAGMAYFLGLRKRGCAIIRIGASTPALHLDMLQRARATAIVGVPSFLCRLAAIAENAKLDLTKFGVRKAVCIGEAVRGQDFQLNAAGRTIAQRWNASVFSTYGVTELAASLCECEAGCGGHLHPELLYLEALDEQDQPAPDGQVGELTATTFGVEGMPLVRYRTGDYAAIHRQPCACGRASLRIGPIVGRKDHKLKIKGATIFPSTFKVVLDSTPGVGAYVMMARRDGNMADCMEIKLACSADPATVLPELRERCQSAAKVIPELTLVSPGEIESLQMPEGARKRRYFVDLRG